MPRAALVVSRFELYLIDANELTHLNLVRSTYADEAAREGTFRAVETVRVRW